MAPSAADLAALGVLASVTGLYSYLWLQEERTRRATRPPRPIRLLSCDSAPAPFMEQFSLNERLLMSKLRISMLAPDGIPVVAEEVRERDFRRIEILYAHPNTELNEVIDRRLAPLLGVPSTQLTVFVVCSGVIGGQTVHSIERVQGAASMGLIWERLVQNGDFVVLLYVDLGNSARLEEQLDLLQSRGFDINVPDPEIHRTLFSDACALGLVDSAKALAARGAKTDFPLRNGHLPITRAIINGHPDMVRYLVKTLHTDVNAKDASGAAPIHYAVRHSRTDIVDTLLELGADLSSQDASGDTVLHVACGAGNLTFVQKYASRSGISTRNRNGDTPLSIAAAAGHLGIAEAMFSLSPDVSVANNDGETPFLVAARLGHDSIVEFFLRSGTNIECKNALGETALFLAAKNGHVPTTKLLLERGATRDVVASGGLTPALAACKKGQTAAFSALLTPASSKTVIEQTDDEGNSAFLLACIGGDIALITMLISMNVDVSARNKQGFNGFYLACQHNNVVVVRFLYSRAICSANPASFERPDGKTPVAVACAAGSTDVVRYLLESPPLTRHLEYYLTTPTADGMLPVHLSTKAGDATSLISLILSGSKFGSDAKTPTGVTPIQLAANSGKKDVTEVILIALVAQHLGWDIRETFEKIGSFEPHQAQQVSEAMEAVLEKLNGEPSPLFSHTGDEVRMVLEVPSVILVSGGSNFLASSVAILGKMRSGQLKCGIMVRYKDDPGQIGVDAGGLFRDWFHRLAQELFSEKLGLVAVEDVNGVPFISLSPYTDVFQLDSAQVDTKLAFRSLGILVGLSITSNLPLGIKLAPHLIKQIVNITPTFADLKFVRSREYDYLSVVLNKDLPDQERQDALDTLDLTFEITSREVEVAATMGTPTRRLEHQMSVLRDDNPSEAVTLDNVATYVKLLVEKRLIQDIKTHLTEFLDGVHDCLPRALFAHMQTVSVEDLQVLISGDAKIDPADWRTHSAVTPEELKGSELVEWFWKYVESLDDEHRSKLLFWITGWKCLPIKGFSALPHKTVLNLTSASEDHLPAAHTCSCQVDIPRFKAYEQLCKKFNMAMEHQEFGLV